MTDWQAVLWAIRCCGYTLQQISDRLDDFGINVSCMRLSELSCHRYSHRPQRVMHDIGDGLLRMLEEVNPAAYERLYVQTRRDRRREWAA